MGVHWHFADVRLYGGDCDGGVKRRTALAADSSWDSYSLMGSELEGTKRITYIGRKKARVVEIIEYADRKRVTVKMK